jgi:hypothetical protein
VLLCLFNDTSNCFLLHQETGAIGKQIKDGIRLMGRGAEEIKWPIHLEVHVTSLKRLSDIYFIVIVVISLQAIFQE